MRLKNRIAIITGAGTGIGEAIAHKFAREGAYEASYVTGSLWLADGGTTPAKGSPGTPVSEEFRRAPKGVLPLKHSHDGENGKEIYRAPK